MTESLNPHDYGFLKEFLRDRIGHELGDGKEYLVISRLGPVAEGLKLSSIGGLCDRLRKSRDLAAEKSVCEAMVTCETSFFRNPSAFERLRLSVIPSLLEARKSERKLRIWCAGCSTGQEPYSIGMLLLEHFLEIKGWDVRIVATDLSERVLHHAERGEYSEREIHRGLSDALIRSFFTVKRHRWTVEPALRNLVTFEKLNLIPSFHLPTQFDLIFMRNVLIYFASESRAAVFTSLRRVIRDDGFLFLGEAETILGQGDAFRFAENGMDYYRPSRI